MEPIGSGLTESLIEPVALSATIELVCIKAEPSIEERAQY